MCCYQRWEKLPSGNAFLNKSINCAIVSLPFGQSILNLLNQSIIWSSVKLVFSMQKSMSSDFKYDPVYLVNKIQLWFMFWSLNLKTYFWNTLKNLSLNLLIGSSLLSMKTSSSIFDKSKSKSLIAFSLSSWSASHFLAPTQKEFNFRKIEGIWIFSCFDYVFDFITIFILMSFVSDKYILEHNEY